MSGRSSSIPGKPRHPKGTTHSAGDRNFESGDMGVSLASDAKPESGGNSGISRARGFTGATIQKSPARAVRIERRGKDRATCDTVLSEGGAGASKFGIVSGATAQRRPAQVSAGGGRDKGRGTETVAASGSNKAGDSSGNSKQTK